MYRSVEQWGTVIDLDVRDAIDESVIDACERWFVRVDDLFSTWRDDTEIMRIACGDLDVADASAEVKTVLDLCDRMLTESGGAFDISFGARAKVPPRPGLAPLDPSGLVKGWAVARAADLLCNAGASNFCVNAGGDVLTAGRPEPDAEGWRVGIQHPWERQRVAAVLVASNLAVATSGRYERGDHVIDPRTALPATGLASVTVIGPDLAIADAYATAAVALGPTDGMLWLASRPGYEGMGITDSRTTLFTAGFDDYRVS
ncbi:MAG TPA: FAD:protein FMN transferase [Acidimicrobiia bacterium]|nr:FAD:protein FMN transferase [Acidimicrobiia bacterium]